MPGFRIGRLGLGLTNANRVSLQEVCEAIADALQPAHFFVAPPLELVWEHVDREVIPWEIFRGRLLDRSQTRELAELESWNIYQVEKGSRSAEPLLSVKLDGSGGRIYVVRAIHCYAWEGYDSGNNVFLSRQTQKWVRELVGQICIDRFTDLEPLHDELVCLVFHAVVGTSRLPLTSVEAPLPQFTLGRLAYFHRPGVLNEHEPIRSPGALVELYQGLQLTALESAKLLETVLRATPANVWPGLSLRSPGDKSRASLRSAPATHGWLAVLRRLFDEVALSPYTGFVDSALRFLHFLEDNGSLSAADAVDFLSYLLRHVVRHLTAYDLITFHHQGANYPDALLLDAALKEYLQRIERAPGLFFPDSADDSQVEHRKRIRRRALRQAWLLRRFYEGLAIPDAPTSPGENARILPPPHVRVPEEQILDPTKRTKRLFDGDPLSDHIGSRSRQALELSAQDLSHQTELRELGLALFLDRPLGIGKAPTEPDQTLLMSYEAFSRSIAQRRLRYLSDELGLIAAVQGDTLLTQLREVQVPGVPLPLAKALPRPGAVSPDDACRVAPDFVFLRTTRRSLLDLRDQLDFSEVDRQVGPDVFAPDKRALFVRDDEPEWLALYDADLKKRLRLCVRAEECYIHRGGCEMPFGGLEANMEGHVFNVPLREAR